ncbi:hypothetical protein TNCV_4879211 [Trichonephila clavipes]|nr:hypothetical protein TNCV_4879211 [Trichonephila clavipes]
MISLLKAHCRPPINDRFHSRCLLHSHWTSSSEVTPPLQAQVSKTMNIRVPDRAKTSDDYIKEVGRVLMRVKGINVKCGMLILKLNK